MHDRVTTGIEDFGLQYFRFTTFDLKVHYDTDDASLKWNKANNLDFDVVNGQCYTLTFPQEIIKLGIFKLEFFFESNMFINLFVHQEGLFGTDLPAACPTKTLHLYGNEILLIPMKYELLSLLQYDGQNCNNERNYKLDQCRDDFIHQVRFIADTYR